MATRKLEAPIDRPLSKAYLREFDGWSTAYPPGISEPNSLRLMENVWITREGACSIRPGLRSILGPNIFLTTTHSQTMVGGFEHFYTNAGERALLYAYRRSDNTVGFSAMVYNSTKGYYEVKALTALGFSIPQGMSGIAFSAATKYVRYVQIDNKILALSDAGEDARIFWVGSTKSAKRIEKITFPRWNGTDKPDTRHPTASWITNDNKVTVPTAQAPGETTLIHSTASKNTYNFAYFYTFFNEVGETAASQLRHVKVQRSYSTWEMVEPLANGSAGTTTSDMERSRDQLVTSLPNEAYVGAKAQGALGWRLYCMSWSDQGVVPVDAILVDEVIFKDSGTRQTEGWIAHTPLITSQDVVRAAPNKYDRDNFTDPPSASQGLVVGDRIVFVYDKKHAGRIQWSGNLMGEYINTSPSVGGGFKTLTSGNLQVPAAVKLWQNPQSVDTITILCMGLDGYSASYYMSPNSEVSGQTAATVVMGFEETTATQGTTSPYGVEVLNNALYHPADPELIKSTASNYNISHKSITDPIQNKWIHLRNKQNIVSAQLDNRLYYIVDNPDGAPVEAGCMGNEVWVCDTATENKWSRWKVQGHSLRKLDLDGKLYMALCHPRGVFVFDDQRAYDEFPGVNTKDNVPITWKMETNTQGANRAHDAWAVLQQANVTLGTFYGTMRYGIRGYDTNGKLVEVSKTYRQLNYVDPASRPMPFDIEDFFLIRRVLKEWFFFAESVPDTGDRSLPSFGQINFIQYRYAPASVNVGYEYGSVETQEYGRSQSNWNDRTTDNGVPIPFIDTGRP